MKRVSACAVLLCMASAGTAPAQAADVWSSPPVRIASLEIVAASGVVRLGVRPRALRGGPLFNFNPAQCSRLTVPYDHGAEDAATRRPALEDTHILDLPLESGVRSAAERAELLGALYAAFVTSRRVQLLVPDDRCTAGGVRLVVGLRMLD